MLCPTTGCGLVNFGQADFALSGLPALLLHDLCVRSRHAQHKRERSVLLAPMARHGRSACSANGGEPARELRLRARGLPVALLGEGLEVGLLLGGERDAVEARACARTQTVAVTLACRS